MSAIGEPRAILVVEDEHLVRGHVADHFRNSGWHVVEASSGEEALAHVQAGLRLHAVFTDIQLGGQVSGWDVAEHCRSAHPDVVVLYASGKPADRSRVVSGGEFFGKPYMVAEVVRTCQRLSDT